MGLQSSVHPDVDQRARRLCVVYDSVAVGGPTSDGYASVSVTLNDSRRRGIVVMEVMVALLLSVLVLSLIASTIIAQSRLARVIGERIAYNDAARATMHIMPAELRLATANDIRVTSPDSVNARWMRSSGAVCFARAPDVWIRVRGIRDPDPSKDSMLVIGESGETAVRLTTAARDASKCPAQSGEDVFRVRTAGGAPPVTGVVMIFESGNYYLSQRALRYRI